MTALKSFVASVRVCVCVCVCVCGWVGVCVCGGQCEVISYTFVDMTS